jgi:2-C-methyl-D-erythritol 2,4-cyclodiphosphate synthase
MIRIGNGIDVHRFDTEAGDKAIVLGGISMSHTHALLAHSDGDLLTHALMDAFLGALALGDIGQHFPDTDEKYRDVSSMCLLDVVMNKVKDAGWQLGNVDITVVAQAPRLSPHIEPIRNSLAAGMKVEADLVSVKATTSEGLGFTGRSEGIAVFATVLLTKP